MALPPEITPITATTGPWVLSDGTFARGRATVTNPVNNVHLPTATPIVSGDMTVILSDGMASWDLCPNDQDGLEHQGDWQYTLKVELYGAYEQPPKVPFSLAQHGPAVVDLDNPGAVVTPPASTVALVGSGLVGTSTIAA